MSTGTEQTNKQKGVFTNHKTMNKESLARQKTSRQQTLYSTKHPKKKFFCDIFATSIESIIISKLKRVFLMMISY